MFNTFNTLDSTMKFIARLSGVLVLIGGVMVNTATFNTYYSRTIRLSSYSIKFYENVAIIDPYVTMSVAILTVYFVVLGWEGVNRQSATLMQVYGWGMVVFAIIILIFTLCCYAGEDPESKEAIQQEIRQIFLKYETLNYHDYEFRKPKRSHIERVQYMFQCCGRNKREETYGKYLVGPHGRYMQLPLSCCHNGLSVKRCEWGENFKKGCPEAIRREYMRILTICRIVYFIYALILLFGAMGGFLYLMSLESSPKSGQLKTNIQKREKLRDRDENEPIQIVDHSKHKKHKKEHVEDKEEKEENEERRDKREENEEREEEKEKKRDKRRQEREERRDKREEIEERRDKREEREKKHKREEREKRKKARK